MASASCYATAPALSTHRRYQNNVYHQAEVVFPMLLAALNDRPPRTIYWRMELLPYSRGMLLLMKRPPWRSHAMRLVVGNHTGPARSERCRNFGATSTPGAYFHSPRDAAAVRDAVLRACELPRRAAARLPADAQTRAVFMPRAGVGLQSGTRRNFLNAPRLVRALATELSVSPAPVTVPTPGGEVDVCEQVAAWSAADVLLTPNGAHFVNAPFMAPGALLVEGVPWSMREYVGQPLLTRHSSIVHVRLHSSRPPRSAALAPFNRVNESECAASEICRRRYRDHADLRVTAEYLRSKLRPALELASCRDADGWKNPFGKTCADYSTPTPPTPNRVRHFSGGWCEGGDFKPGARWAGGEKFSWPERACCACGRGQRQRRGKPRSDGVETFKSPVD